MGELHIVHVHIQGLTHEMRVAVCVSICNIGGVNLYFIVCHIHNSITFILHNMLSCSCTTYMELALHVHNGVVFCRSGHRLRGRCSFTAGMYIVISYYASVVTLTTLVMPYAQYGVLSVHMISFSGLVT